MNYRHQEKRVLKSYKIILFRKLCMFLKKIIQTVFEKSQIIDFPVGYIYTNDYMFLLRQSLL